MVGTTTGGSGRSPASTSRMEIMLGASTALGGRVAAGCESPALGIKAGALTVNVESGLEGAVALLARADLPNLEALDPDQIAWARGRCPSFRTATWQRGVPTSRRGAASSGELLVVGAYAVDLRAGDLVRPPGGLGYPAG
jgi:hypothetical protein